MTMECAVKERSCKNIESGNLKIVQQYYKDVFKFINEGLSLEEDSEKRHDAIISYKNGLRLCEAAIYLPHGAENLNSEDKEKYNKIILNLTRAKEETKQRLMALENDENLLTTTSTSHDLQSNLPADNENTDSKENVDTWQDVKELLRIDEGVNMFHVDNKGSVSAWMSPCNIEVFQILKQCLEKVSPAGFMKCGEWVYPMEPGKSPVLRTKNRTYVFPDLSGSSQLEDPQTSSLPCIGIILAEFVPEKLVKRFERILSCYCDFRVESKEKPKRPPPPAIHSGEQCQMVTPSAPSEDEVEEIIASPGIVSDVNKENWADKISSGIHVGSQWVSWGFVKGAEYATALVEKGAQSLRRRIKPNQEFTQVDPELSRNMRQLHLATGSVVQISTFLVIALGNMTINLGKKMAPYVQHHGQKLLPVKYQWENNEKNQQKLENVKKVATAGLEGFGLIFLALEQAGKNLYQGLSIATVQTLEHKYGNEVGEITQNAMGVAGNTVQAYWNVKKLGAKAIAKRAVKDTGKAMLLDHDGKPVNSIEFGRHD